jgi:hypothetical protein
MEAHRAHFDAALGEHFAAAKARPLQSQTCNHVLRKRSPLSSLARTLGISTIRTAFPYGAPLKGRLVLAYSGVSPKVVRGPSGCGDLVVLYWTWQYLVFLDSV